VSASRHQERAREVFTGRKVDGLSAEETDRARCAGYEPDGEYLVGRDPRTMAQDELKAMGHGPLPPVAAIRLKCLDCAGSSDEVRKCVAIACVSWPFRTGKNPWRTVSEARREAGRRAADRLRGKSPEPRLDLAGSAEEPAAASSLPRALASPSLG
jgi:hypothetical protein